jgi:hypothetical protein
MTEQYDLNFCGLCSHFSRGKWNSSKGLFDNYCNVLKKNVSIIGYACPDFERRVDKPKETEWEVTEVIRRW